MYAIYPIFKTIPCHPVRVQDRGEGKFPSSGTAVAMSCTALVHTPVSLALCLSLF